MGFTRAFRNGGSSPAKTYPLLGKARVFQACSCPSFPTIASLFSTLVNACSGIYDKYLLQIQGFTPATVQAWFSVYLAVIMLPFYLGWRAGLWKRRGRFEWRWSIPLIAISLLCADFVYFTAMHQEGALVAVITPIRRCSVIISFLMGTWLLKEKSSKKKTLGLIGIMIGMMVIFTGA